MKCFACSRIVRCDCRDCFFRSEFPVSRDVLLRELARKHFCSRGCLEAQDSYGWTILKFAEGRRIEAIRRLREKMRIKCYKKTKDGEG